MCWERERLFLKYVSWERTLFEVSWLEKERLFFLMKLGWERNTFLSIGKCVRALGENTFNPLLAKRLLLLLLLLLVGTKRQQPLLSSDN